MRHLAKRATGIVCEVHGRRLDQAVDEHLVGDRIVGRLLIELLARSVGTEAQIELLVTGFDGHGHVVLAIFGVLDRSRSFEEATCHRGTAAQTLEGNRHLVCAIVGKHHISCSGEQCFVSRLQPGRTGGLITEKRLGIRQRLFSCTERLFGEVLGRHSLDFCNERSKLVGIERDNLHLSYSAQRIGGINAVVVSSDATIEPRANFRAGNLDRRRHSTATPGRQFACHGNCICHVLRRGAIPCVRERSVI